MGCSGSKAAGTKQPVTDAGKANGNGGTRSPNAAANGSNGLSVKTTGQAQQREGTSPTGRRTTNGTAPTPPPNHEALFAEVLSGVLTVAIELQAPPEEQLVLLRAAANTCLDVARQTMRLKGEAGIGVLRAAAKSTGKPLIVTACETLVDRCVDDGMQRLFIAWFQHGAVMPAVAGALAHDGLAEFRSRFKQSHHATFVELLRDYYRLTQKPELQKLFFECTGGEVEMHPAQMTAFLRDKQRYESITDHAARDKLRSCFGNHLCRFNFSSYYSSYSSNAALDPARAATVWQDMTRPLTHYSVHTEPATTLPQLVDSIEHGVRAFIFSVSVAPPGTTIYPPPAVASISPPTSSSTTATATPTSQHPPATGGAKIPHCGSASTTTPTSPATSVAPFAGSALVLQSAPGQLLQPMFDALREKAFTRDRSYPVILAFTTVMSLEVQEQLARMLIATFGNTLAKGLMFEGAMVNDPQFTPAALQHKFLVMASQASLKPFVGFLVADMQREGLGVRVTDVKEKTPASKAGVVKDDWLTHIQGRPIPDRNHLRDELKRVQLGEEFVLTKENMDELRVVVGGAIDRDDSTHAKLLSDIVFLKLRDDNGPGCAPWEAEVPLLGGPPSPAKRSDLGTHFALVTVDGARVDDPLAYDQDGVQFVNAACEKAVQWGRGKFLDNGNCGFLLKRQPGHPRFDVRLTMITAPASVAPIPSPAAKVSPPASFASKISGDVSPNNNSSSSVLQYRFEAHPFRHQANGRPTSPLPNGELAVSTSAVPIGIASANGSASGSGTPPHRDLSNHQVYVSCELDDEVVGLTVAAGHKMSSPVLSAPNGCHSLPECTYFTSFPFSIVRRGYHTLKLRRQSDGALDTIVVRVERELVGSAASTPCVGTPTGKGAAT